MTSKIQHKYACLQPNLHIILLIIVYFAILNFVYLIFVDLAYSELEETEMLALFTNANELGFEQGLINSPEEKMIDLQHREKGAETNNQTTHICRIKGCGGAEWPPPTNNFRKT